VKNYTIKKYEPQDYDNWNAFIGKAKNATFLFHRNFMEYHSDRFEDYSLMVFEGKKLVAVLPANVVGNEVFSHQGLTYGGFVFENDLYYPEIKLVILKVLCFLKENSFKELIINNSSSIYCNYGLKDTTSFLMDNGAKIVSKKMNLAIDFKSDFKISKSKLKHFKKRESVGLEIRKESDLSIFWIEVLIPRLLQKFNSKPVHSLDEITLLQMKFPKNIIQYNVYLEGKILAGLTIFKSNTVVKSQYGATTENGEKHRALDFLYLNLINEFKDKYNYFDMGTVDDDSKMGYNEGLLNQKKELGCDLYYQNKYQIML
jgi:hypothetical protein